MKDDFDRYLKFAVRIAQESGRIQMASYGRVKKIRFKGEINLVTEVDKRCEAMIIKNIRKNFPDHDILAEESGKARESGSDYKWIIDPLDGTTNYSHSYPLFCTSIGLEYRGKVIVGVVFEPNLRELFYAVRGKGAFLNRRRIHVSKIAKLRRALVSTGFAYNVQEVKSNNLDHFQNFIMTSQAVRRDGVAATDLCYVACGRFDGFWEINLFPWDVAAGSLIVEEAGGAVSHFDGSSLDIYGKEIVANNGRIHRAMIEVLNGKY
ncbi:MAG: inositol monophosphatase [Deltaproteobacteria bacterium]|nr:inositol monophosphatase [Deltaproteobacteria bacterium]